MGRRGLTLGPEPANAILKYGNAGKIFAFKLGGKAALPKVTERNLDIPEPPASAATAAQIENGKFRYTATCMVCHGALVVSGGVVPDLRRLTTEKHSIFKQIVYDGVIHSAGMPRMGDLVSLKQDVADIQAYIIERSRQDRAAAATAAAKP